MSNTNNPSADTSHILHERLILQKTKQSAIQLVKNLNCWGKALSDVSILQQMPNVQILSLSVNKIASLRDFSGLRDLRELYLRKNEVRDMSEIRHLQNLRNLSVLWLMDNPITEQSDYRMKVIAALPQLTKLDSNEISNEERILATQKYPSMDSIINSSLSSPTPARRNTDMYSSPAKHSPQVGHQSGGNPQRNYVPSRSPPRHTDIDQPTSSHISQPPPVRPSPQRSQWAAPSDVQISHAINLRDDETYVYNQFDQNGEVERLRGTVENLQLQLQVQQEKQQLMEEKHRMMTQRDNGVLEATLLLVRSLNPQQLAAVRQEIDRLLSP